MTLGSILDTQTADATAALFVSDIWKPAFPSVELVSAAAGLLPRLPAWNGSEGPRSRIVVTPGQVTITEKDPVRAERAAEAALRRRQANVMLQTVDLLLPDRLEDAEAVEEAVSVLVAAGLVKLSELDRAIDQVDVLRQGLERLESLAGKGIRGSGIVSWSQRSRSRMGKVLMSLDWAPLFEAGTPAMVTLTYPGDWLAVAPDAKTCREHVKTLKKRFNRAWGKPLVGAWKREFQRRGAPHYHILMVPPNGTLNGEDFKSWLSRSWSEIVNAEVCKSDYVPKSECCERHRHRDAGTNVDVREGIRYADPVRLAVYFSKHGSFAAKDYQNDAPAEWVEAGSVGRFWGVWGLEKVQAAVEVDQVVALAAARTLRRHFRANGYRVQRQVWRKKYTVDPATGETTSWRWVKRNSGRRARRIQGRLGWAALNDAPAFVSQLSRYLDQVAADRQ